MIGRLNHVAIAVGDIAKASAVYRRRNVMRVRKNLRNVGIGGFEI